MPDGVFEGNPTFTSDGGGSFTGSASSDLRIRDGGAGSPYDWTSGPWSVQVDFAFPAAPKFGAFDHALLVSKGSFSSGTGWELQVNNSVFQGRYQIMFESNHGANSYNLVSGYYVVPGAFNRALFVCNQTGTGVWYVNGTAGNSQACAPSSSGATDLLIGRYSATPDYASLFPITRVQIWNRALTAVEAAQSTTGDPTPQ
jgi:hypothetical protein